MDRKIIRKETISCIDIKDIDEETTKNVLEFLNNVKSAEDIDSIIELEGKRDIGFKIGERILAKRDELGGFKSLEDIINIPMIGPKRFVDIVTAIESKGVDVDRLNFKALLLKNPNYFGNIPGVEFEPVVIKQSDTSYEELTCIGYNPQARRLEAIVHIKKSYGYGSGLCGNGTQEYVRFFIDWNNDGNWSDLGVVSFTAYNILGRKPLEYAVTLNITPKEELCSRENIPKVRAILSWNVIPPSNPNHIPVWGNVKESRIQINKRNIKISDVITDNILAKYNLTINNLESSILEQPIEIKEEILDLKRLYELYKEKVSVERYAFPTIHKLMTESKERLELSIKNIIDIDEKIIDAILQLNYNTRYEELTCIGYDKAYDELIATIKIKQPYGYLGNLCSKGSKEYVSFWADFGSGWVFVGTTSVDVYDLSSIPPEVDYAVYLPLNSLTKRQPCDQVKLVKIRAILSWNVIPPLDPNYIPYWGNVKDTLIQLEPSDTPTGHKPVIQSVGSISTANINSSGLANGIPIGGGCLVVDAPFGGSVKISGKIANPPNWLGSAASPLKYKVYVSSDGINWEQLTNKFTIYYNDLINGSWTPSIAYTQQLDSNGYYTYIEDFTGSYQRHVAENVLAIWDTGSKQGLYRIKVEVKDDMNNTYYSDIVYVMINNKAPKASITITSGGGPCADFKIGDTIIGTYNAYDTEYFGSLSIGVQPALGGSITPSTRSYPTVPTTGESGTWTLNTSGMSRCGYIVEIYVYDRTIVNNSSCNHYVARAVVGLCLRE